ncbi:hypothetical protein CVT26_001858 [Gymnopilus dilepis]|uniref:Uncharacterized protein n=1 Tax=Gymnopilus dilepis TaxID=231916 RepID=A0A409WB26_9AGAR|nr:hypothetical protein CVT26_001858 [Gymnopilus dilepis]
MPTSAPQVHKLPHDILLSIFFANANEADIIPSDPEEEEWRDPDAPQHPLTTTRRSSQVCRAWRELILDSATLWGRLLDLDALHGQRANQQWREQVLRRAGGTAPLFTSLRILATAFLPEFSLLTAALSHMPLLEELSVFGCTGTTSLDALTLDQLLLPPHTPHIPLPRLRRLVVQGDLNTCFLLTKGIRPAAGCALKFESTCRAGDTISEDVLAALGGLFREYFAGYLGRYDAPDTEWAFYVEVPKPMVRIRLKSGRSDWPCVFLVSWYTSFSIRSGDVVQGLFFPSPSTLSPSRASAEPFDLLARFASIEHLRFWSRVTLDSAKPVVRDVLASFTSMKTLEARGVDLSFIFLPLAPDPLQLLPTADVNTTSTSSANEIGSDQHLFPSAASSPSISKFPALHTITWSDSICTSDFASTVLPILHARVEAGCKLRMLEFSRPLDNSMGNDKFEALVGECVGPLVGRVRWREGEDVVDLWAEG